MKLDDREKAKRALARAVRVAEWANDAAWRAMRTMMEANAAFDKLRGDGQEERLIQLLRAEVTTLTTSGREAYRKTSDHRWAAVYLARWIGAKESR